MSTAFEIGQRIKETEEALRPRVAKMVDGCVNTLYEPMLKSIKGRGYIGGLVLGDTPCVRKMNRQQYKAARRWLRIVASQLQIHFCSDYHDLIVFGSQMTKIELREAAREKQTMLGPVLETFDIKEVIKS